MKYAIDDAEIDFERNRMVRAGAETEIEPKVGDVLRYLAERPLQVVSRESLIDAVWKGASVSDDVLSRCATVIRRLFDDDARAPRVLETITKRGYRLIAQVRPLDEAAGRIAPSPRFAADLLFGQARLVLADQAQARERVAAAAMAERGGAGREVRLEAAGPDLVVAMRRFDLGLAAAVIGAVVGGLVAYYAVIGHTFQRSEVGAMVLAATVVGAGLGFMVRRAARAAVQRRMRRDIGAVLQTARIASPPSPESRPRG
jgi:DNA-binding winged helix-turn-helix (wHTH) protein